jgi:isoleucyl-tRNA synthetase
MVADRPDWCISRQKSWGLPIPAFFCESCGAVHIEPHTIRNVAKVFRQKGSTSWFELPAADFLPPGAKCAQCGSASFRKETDIFDVWFESGSSHRAVCRQESELTWPADLYLEGHDQHRGWFQLSLIIGTAADNSAPYRTVLTHGFVIDDKGQKMSKSLGNFISVGDALKEFGGEIIRLWVSSVNFRDDIGVSRELIAKLSDAYRRIRNTFRFLLGNLNDFDPDKDSVADHDLVEIDRWALAELARLTAEVTRACDDYQFHRVFHLVHNFCVVEMSSFYLDILKDRLYCDARASSARRAAQTVLYRILATLVKLLAPILVHTCEEVWHALPGRKETESVHLALWPAVDEAHVDDALAARWERMISVRTEVLRSLEALRAAKTIGGSLEAGVTLYTEDEDLFNFLKPFEPDLPMIFITSAARIILGTSADAVQSADIPALYVEAAPSKFAKCKRCWNFRETVGSVAAHADLCERCANVVDNL